MFRTVSPTVVREWFASNPDKSEGITLPHTGRISDAAVKVYNRHNKGAKRYEPAGYAGKTFKVTAKPEKGRAVTKTVIEREVRAAAVAAGVPVGKRGALPKEVREAYVLGTLSSLVPQG